MDHMNNNVTMNPTEAAKKAIDVRSDFLKRTYQKAFPTDGNNSFSAQQPPKEKKHRVTSHRKTRTDKKLFPCTVPGCNKSFTRKNHVTTHIRTHTGERPFPCPFDGCNKFFAHGNSLTNHIRIHTGEKPYTCTFESCNKSFTQQSNLTQHINRIHTGEKL